MVSKIDTPLPTPVPTEFFPVQNLTLAWSASCSPGPDGADAVRFGKADD
jgi:hypothetical protein